MNAWISEVCPHGLERQGYWKWKDEKKRQMSPASWDLGDSGQRLKSRVTNCPSFLGLKSSWNGTFRAQTGNFPDMLDELTTLELEIVWSCTESKIRDMKELD